MKLNLIETLCNKGLFTECKAVIKDKITIDVGCDGVLILTSTTVTNAIVRKVFKTKDGVVTIDDFDIIQGVSKVEFDRADGTAFNCGEFHRSSRFLTVKSNADELVLALAQAHIESEKKFNEISKRLAEIEARYGISLI